MNLYLASTQLHLGKSSRLTPAPKGGYQEFPDERGSLQPTHPRVPRARREEALPRRTRKPHWLATITLSASPGSFALQRRRSSLRVGNLLARSFSRARTSLARHTILARSPVFFKPFSRGDKLERLYSRWELLWHKRADYFL